MFSKNRIFLFFQVKKNPEWLMKMCVTYTEEKHFFFQTNNTVANSPMKSTLELLNLSQY